MIEGYHEHPTYKNYCANENGEVIHILKSGFKEIKGTILKGNGYRILKIGGVKRLWSRFVYECFYGLIPEGLCIDHKNRNRTDNRISNLRLVTPSGNQNTEETAEYRKNQYLNRERVHIDKINIYTNEVIDTYISPYAAAMLNNMPRRSARLIKDCCENLYGRKTIGGFKWRYSVM